MTTTQDLLNMIKLELPPQRPPNIGITIKELAKSMGCSDKIASTYLKGNKKLVAVTMLDSRRKLVFLRKEEVEQNEHYKFWIVE